VEVEPSRGPSPEVEAAPAAREAAPRKRIRRVAGPRAVSIRRRGLVRKKKQKKVAARRRRR
jgi:hypothetical protein